MSGIFSGLNYDAIAYKEALSRSTNPLMYRLDPNQAINCNKCFTPYGPRGGHDNAVAVGNQIDVDSILRGVNKIHSRSNEQQLPEAIDQYQLYAPPECGDMLEPEYTRYTHPAYDIRGLNVKDMHFEYPINDPQCQIFENFQINTRLQAKDNHRAIWQQPMSQTNAMPTQKPQRPARCRVDIKCDEPYN